MPSRPLGTSLRGWEAIASDIDKVTDALNEAKDDALADLTNRIQSDLDAARDEWNDLVRYATDLQTRTKLSVTSAQPA